jgi:hypothetical protein
MVCASPHTAMAVSGLSTAGAAGLAVHEPVLNGELNAGLLVDDEWDDLEERGDHGWSSSRASKVWENGVKVDQFFGTLVALLWVYQHGFWANRIMGSLER